ncbi:lisH domain-containing protein [Phthorimaea operculella]|nr:lisH domain-containing protein [Phthorimaea operculella]
MDEIEIARSPCAETKNGKLTDREKESVDNFQKFFYELFEKNGILNDLRAYLRRHIVDVLKNSNTGDAPMCQKHFTQRLELKSQALNILVAEYLLQSELNYTLSVFVSEIPLANMVFDFAAGLMKGEGAGLRFKDKDIWTIIQHLGIRCDSKQICRILELYKNGNQSLLFCIIKSLQIAVVEAPSMDPATSDEALSSEKSFDSLSDTNKKHKCHQHALCKACIRLRDKYKRRKENEKMKETSAMASTINSLMKKIGNIEGNLVNEMFDQLKTVYETELEMMRSKQERRVQQAIQEHAQTLQQQRQELEDAYKAREEDLERGVRAKKKFLWGLARTLRTQHDQLARAMIAVKYHTQRLKVKGVNFLYPSTIIYSVQLARAMIAVKYHTQRLKVKVIHYKDREENLRVRAKKKFLWGLARTLRTQHDQLARAMIAVKYHTQRLKVKVIHYKDREENLRVRAKKKFLWGLARTLRTQHDQLARAMIAVKYHTQRLKVKVIHYKASGVRPKKKFLWGLARTLRTQHDQL